MTPIERAARALVDAYPCLPREQRAADDPAMLDVARAVIAAIREPSEGMIPEKGVFAGFCHDADGVEDNHYLTTEEARYAWRAMIDELLAEGKR